MSRKTGSNWRLSLVRIALFILQWCLLTVGLGAVVVYSAPDLDGLISPHFDLTLMIAAALVMAAVLGLIVRSMIVAILLSVLMCAGSTLMFAITMFAPTFNGAVVRTGDLENFVTTRMLLYALLMVIPALIGVLIGNLAGGALDERREILTERTESQRGWWSSST